VTFWDTDLTYIYLISFGVSRSAGMQLLARWEAYCCERASLACLFFQLVLHLDVWYTYALFFMLMISKEVGHEGGYREVFWEKVDIVFKDMLPCLLKI